MSTPATTFDPARELDLFFRIGRDGSKTLVFLKPDGTPYDISAIVFDLVIKQKSSVGTVLYRPVLSKPATNKLQVDVTTAATVNIHPRVYYWELTVNSGAKTWLTGDCIFHGGKFDGVSSDTSTLTIGDTSQVINVYVTDSLGVMNQPLFLKVHVTSAEIKNCFSAPKIILPAQGAGKMIHPLALSTKYTHNGISYVGGENAKLKMASLPVQSVGIMTTTGYLSFNLFAGGTVTDLSLSNAALVFTSDINPTTGNGDLDFYLTYRILDL